MSSITVVSSRFILLAMTLSCQAGQIGAIALNSDLQFQSRLYFPDNIPADQRKYESQSQFTQPSSQRSIVSDSRQPIRSPSTIYERKSADSYDSSPIIFEDSDILKDAQKSAPYAWIRDWLASNLEGELGEQGEPEMGEVTAPKESRKWRNIKDAVNKYSSTNYPDEELANADADPISFDIRFNDIPDSALTSSNRNSDSEQPLRYHSLIGVGRNRPNCSPGYRPDVLWNCRRVFG